MQRPSVLVIAFVGGLAIVATCLTRQPKTRFTPAFDTVLLPREIPLQQTARPTAAPELTPVGFLKGSLPLPRIPEEIQRRIPGASQSPPQPHKVPTVKVPTLKHPFPTLKVPTVKVATLKVPTVKLPTLKYPTLKVPTLKVPTVKVATLKLPTVKLPTLKYPTLKVPTIKVPTVKVATLKVPTLKFPTVKYPSVKVPTLRIPTIKVPTVKVATLKVPTIKVPTLKYPSLKVPTLKIPTIKVATLKIPTVKVPTIKYPTLKVPTLKIPTVKVVTIKYPTIKYPTIKYPTIKYPTIKYPTIKYPTIKYPTIKIATLKIPPPPVCPPITIWLLGCRPGIRPGPPVEEPALPLTESEEVTLGARNLGAEPGQIQLRIGAITLVPELLAWADDRFTIIVPYLQLAQPVAARLLVVGADSRLLAESAAEIFPGQPPEPTPALPELLDGETTALGGVKLGAEPGQVQLKTDQLTLAAEIQQWQDDHCTVKLPFLALSEPTRFELVMLRADGEEAMSMEVLVTPVEPTEPMEGQGPYERQGEVEGQDQEQTDRPNSSPTQPPGKPVAWRSPV